MTSSGHRGTFSPNLDLAVLVNALLTAYLAALLFDFWPLMDRRVSLTHILIPSAIRPIATLTDLEVGSQSSLVVAAFVLGYLFSPVLRHRLSNPNTHGSSLGALVPSFAYCVAITFALSLLTSVWHFIATADDSNVAWRVGLAVAGDVFSSAYALIVFAPVIMIATASITFVNVILFRPRS